MAPLGINGRIVAHTIAQRLLRRLLGFVDGNHRAMALVLAQLRVGVIRTVFVAPLVVHDVGDLCHCYADARRLTPRRHRMVAYCEHGQHLLALSGERQESCVRSADAAAFFGYAGGEERETRLGERLASRRRKIDIIYAF